MRIDCWSLSLDPTPTRQTVPVFRGVLRNLEVGERGAIYAISSAMCLLGIAYIFSQPEILIQPTGISDALAALTPGANVVRHRAEQVQWAQNCSQISPDVKCWRLELKDSLFWEFAVSPICLSFVFHWGMGSVVSRHYFLSWGLVRFVPADLVSLSLYGFLLYLVSLDWPTSSYWLHRGGD